MPIGIDLLSIPFRSFARSQREILMNIQSGEACELAQYDSYGALKTRTLNPKRRVLPTHEHYFKTPKQMEELFADYPHSLDVAGRYQNARSSALNRLHARSHETRL